MSDNALLHKIYDKIEKLETSNQRIKTLETQVELETSNQRIKTLETQVEFEQGQKAKAREQLETSFLSTDLSLKRYKELERGLKAVLKVAEHPPCDVTIANIAQTALNKVRLL
jgi:ribosome-associated translation inhibitor RaiA